MNRNESRLVRTDHLQSPGEVFRIPIWLGVASIVGLVSALLGDDVWDVLSWATILAPIAVVAWTWRRRA